MLWVDGTGPDEQGASEADEPAGCMKKKPKVMNIEVISHGTTCDERCPVGVCERYPDGEEEGCRWFFGSLAGDKSYTPSSYKCFVAHCTMVPDQEGFSGCESEHGKNFIESPIVIRHARKRNRRKK